MDVVRYTSIVFVLDGAWVWLLPCGPWMTSDSHDVVFDVVLVSWFDRADIVSGFVQTECCDILLSHERGLRSSWSLSSLWPLTTSV